MTRCKKPALALLALSAATAVHAGDGVWTSNGPDGGEVNQVISVPTNPNQLYAIGGLYFGSGIFRSLDFGVTWQRRTAGVIGSLPRRILPHPTIANRLLLLTDTRILLSDDAGASFSPVMAGLPTAASFRISDVTRASSAPDTLFLTSNQGLYRSIGGAPWTRIGTGTGGLAGDRLGPVAVHPTDPLRVLVSSCDRERTYASSLAAALYLSVDGGNTFTASTGLAEPEFNCAENLSFSPLSPGVVLMGYSGAPMRSTDGGVSFVSVNIGGAISAINGEFVFAGTRTLALSDAGIHRSIDHGATWTFAPMAFSANGVVPAEPTSIAVRPGAPDSWIVGTGYGGIAISTNAGVSFGAANGGFRSSSVRSLAVNPARPQTLLAGFGEGAGRTSPALVRSTDGGATWARSNSGLHLDFVRALTIDANTATATGSGIAYAVGREFNTRGPGTGGFFRPGIAKSNDGGVSWTPLENFVGLTAQQRGFLGSMRAVALDPLSGSGAGATGPRQTLYLTASGRSPVPSTCVGATPTPSPYSVGRLWKSTDGGASWNRLDTATSGFPSGECLFSIGTPSTVVTQDRITPVSIVVNPATPSTLYVGTFSSYSPIDPVYAMPTGPNGVFKSTDGGATWTHASNGLPRYGAAGSQNHSVLALAIDPIAPNTLYAAVNPLDGSALTGGIYKTTNGGASWSNASTGIVGQDIRALIIDPANNFRVYAASGGSLGNPGGVFVSNDGAATWNSFSTGLPPSAALALALDNSTSAAPIVHAGTGAGVFSFTRISDLDGDGPANQIENEAPGKGDGNEDGTLDSQQANVASVPGNGDGNEDSSDSADPDAPLSGPVKTTITVTPLSGTCTQIYDAYAVKAAAVAIDPGRVYPSGLIRLEIANCQRAVLSVRFHGQNFGTGAPSGWTFRNYGPSTPLDPNSVRWNAMTGNAGVSGNTWTMLIEDNQVGDNRSQANQMLFIGGPSTEVLFANGFEN
jgi:hypothetical protein